MHAETTAGHVILGWSAAWVATVIFVAVYVMVVLEKLNRAILALLGAGLMILGVFLPRRRLFAALTLTP